MVLFCGMDTEHGGETNIYVWIEVFPVSLVVFVNTSNAFAQGNDKNMNIKKFWDK